MHWIYKTILLLESFVVLGGALRYNASSDVSTIAGQFQPLVTQNKTIYPALYMPYSASTPPSVNISGAQQTNPLRIAAQGLLDTPKSGLSPRQAANSGTGTCGPGSPCSNGACCDKSGYCGYGSSFCGASVCISNCNATAECGVNAPAGKKVCPLNVCCSQYGFCGTTSDFCGTNCDATGGECGAAPGPIRTGSGPGQRSIGYYESWSPSRPCGGYEPEQLNLLGFTHVNFAFAYFDPTNFKISSMGSGPNSLYSRFTNLKSSNPGLQTWISVGGWAFNDNTNVPNTQTAFSNMVSSASNRQAFISSLISFMVTYGFDGADIDWEYPVASDRGGQIADKANYVLLLSELRSAIGSQYGLSITLPSSYWYLQNFDVTSMAMIVVGLTEFVHQEPYVDWFNFMSYDIHGVWDSANVYEGPYVRPHTNLTEINEGLQLLWRAGVASGKVVLGLGWYGRSFTLSSPSCTTPGCMFSQGGNPGPCTQTAGILSDAEIANIISQTSATPTFDSVAAVKWIVWDSNQWVSYDDAQTFALKMSFAAANSLGGTMVWAIDMGSNSSNSDFSGLSQALSVQPGLISPFGQPSQIVFNIIAQIEESINAQDTCYTTFCGGDCAPGYSSKSQMFGQVGSFGPASACTGNNGNQQLCCMDGSILGGCDWYGFRGLGLSCTGTCPTNFTELATNSNFFTSVGYVNSDGSNSLVGNPCNGGFATYCCSTFTPSPRLTGTPELVGAANIVDPKALAKRDFATCAAVGTIVGGVLILASIVAPPVGLGAAAIFTTICAKSTADRAAISMVAGYAGPLTRSGGITKRPSKRPPFNPKSAPKSAPKTGPKKYGRWPVSDFTGTGQKTCSTTYTCSYGQGFDQVCDNQRWGLDLVLGGLKTVFTYDQFSNGEQRTKQRWAPKHNAAYKRSFGSDTTNGITRNRCEVDEFPMASLAESADWQAQALRSLDGGENGEQGLDWNLWLLAVWHPCSTLIQSPPPVTWDIGPIPAGDTRNNANGIIKKYGWDSSSGKPACFATYTPPTGAQTVIPDHGFRALYDDPLFTAYNWDYQNYQPAPVANNLPTSVNSQAYLHKRGIETLQTLATGKKNAWISGDADPTITVKYKESVSVRAVERNAISSVSATQSTEPKSMEITGILTFSPMPSMGK